MVLAYLAGFGISPTALAVGVPVLLILLSAMGVWNKKWDPRGKHCIVTGGSSGAGLGLAVLLAKQGAHVSIVARNEKRLAAALVEIEKARVSPDQILRSYAFAVNSESGSAGAIKAASEPFDGRCPDAFFLCAGASKPGFFVEQDEASVRDSVELTYFAQVFTALATCKAMVKSGVKGKIVFVSSILGYFSLVGYSTYSPGKHAIRGLAEALQSEFMLYGIDVHIGFPCTIYSPGYEEENRLKPKITLKIEETDGGNVPEVTASVILNGVKRGKFHITDAFIGDVFRASTAGPSERNSYVIDIVYAIIGYVALPVWRWLVDRTVIGHCAEHAEYLRERGLA